MELLDFQALEPKAKVKYLNTLPTLFNPEAFKEYEPENHAVFDLVKRPKKAVNKPDYTNLDENNKPTILSTFAEVVRVGLPFQKLIVDRAATFLTGAPAELWANPENDAEKNLYEMVKKVWQDNKLDYKDMPIAETMMSQREVAEVWYFTEEEKGFWGDLASKAEGLRMAVLKPSEGNKFKAVFDGRRNLIAFARFFETADGDKKIKMLDVYTSDKIELLQEAQGDWLPRKVKPSETLNPFKKIPVIYYSQERDEWQDVQPTIERLEELLSNHGDINDYNGSPAIVASGEIEGFSTKGERGKVFQMTAGADMKYLSWDQAPESIKLEIENLFEIIYTMTQTPNLSFKEVKGMGALSGVAIKLMFMDAHSKARKKQRSNWGECLQRRINLIKAGCIVINPSLQSARNLDIRPIANDYMPVNEEEQARIEQIRVNTLIMATAGEPIISQQQAVELSPLEVEDRAADLLVLQAAAREKAMTLEA